MSDSIIIVFSFLPFPLMDTTYIQNIFLKVSRGIPENNSLTKTILLSSKKIPTNAYAANEGIYFWLAGWCLPVESIKTCPMIYVFIVLLPKYCNVFRKWNQRFIITMLTHHVLLSEYPKGLCFLILWGSRHNYVASKPYRSFVMFFSPINCHTLW